MLRHVEIAAGNNSGLVLLAEQSVELLRRFPSVVSETTTVPNSGRMYSKSSRDVQERIQHWAIRVEQFLRTRLDAFQMIERDHAEQLSRMRGIDAI